MTLTTCHFGRVYIALRFLVSYGCRDLVPQKVPHLSCVSVRLIRAKIRDRLASLPIE